MLEGRHPRALSLGHRIVPARVRARAQVLENVAHRVRRDGGQLYVTGMEPYPDRAPSPGGQLVVEVHARAPGCGRYPP